MRILIGQQQQQQEQQRRRAREEGKEGALGILILIIRRRCTNIDRLREHGRRYRLKTNEKFSRRRRKRGFESTVEYRKSATSSPKPPPRANPRRREREDIDDGFESGERTRRRR
jgi:hypothetical protein